MNEVEVKMEIVTPDLQTAFLFAFKQIKKELNIDSKQLVEIFNLSQPQISKILTGKSPIQIYQIEQFLTHFNYKFDDYMELVNWYYGREIVLVC